MIDVPENVVAALRAAVPVAPDVHYVKNLEHFALEWQYGGIPMQGCLMGLLSYHTQGACPLVMNIRDEDCLKAGISIDEKDRTLDAWPCGDDVRDQRIHAYLQVWPDGADKLRAAGIEP